MCEPYTFRVGFIYEKTVQSTFERQVSEVTFIKNTLTMKDYTIGLSLMGIAVVTLIVLPNAVYLFFTPPNDVLSSNEANYWLWNIFENVGRFGLMITLCFIINKTASTQSRVMSIVATCSLIAYYALWIAYFTGTFNGLSLFGMAFFPSVFFLLSAWRQRNIFAFAFAFAALCIFLLPVAIIYFNQSCAIDGW